MLYGEEWGKQWGKDVISGNLLASNFAENFATAGADLDEHNDDWTRYTGADLGKRPDNVGGFEEIVSGGVTVRARREDMNGNTFISLTQPDDAKPGDILVNDKNEAYRIMKPEGITRMYWHAERIDRPIAV